MVITFADTIKKSEDKLKLSDKEHLVLYLLVKAQKQMSKSELENFFSISWSLCRTGFRNRGNQIFPGS